MPFLFVSSSFNSYDKQIFIARLGHARMRIILDTIAETESDEPT